MSRGGSSPSASVGIVLLGLPFFLQLLGFGGVLGGGLCGELFARETPLSLQGAGFWYSLLFMGLLSFQLMYAVFTGLMLLLSAADPPQGQERPRSSYWAGFWLAVVLLGFFVLTRTVGLPVPSAQGLAWGEPVSANLLSLLMVGMTLAGGLWLGRVSRG